MSLGGSASATSPYDLPYGIQWNFMIGVAGDDGGSSVNTNLDITSDGTVFVQNRTGISTWGSGTGGNVRGGLGAITPLGRLLYGTTVSSLPTMNSPSQQYAAGVSAAGNKAYFTVYGAQSQYWTGEDGKDPNRAMVWSLDSSGLSSIADQHSLSKFTGATGNPPRLDLLQPTTTGLTPAAGQNRIIGSALRDSTMDLVMVMDMVDGDFATAGDYGGYLLRTNGTLNAYLPGIGVYNYNTNTLSGPAKQPILTYSGASPTWSNMGDYRAAGIDQSTGRYYGGGLSHSRTESISDAWDPDGSGPAPSIPFVNSGSLANPAGIGTAYDSANNLLYSVTWDTPGYDVINNIAPTNDGSNGAFWSGEKLDDCYIELRDASGAVVWSDTFNLSPAVAGVPGTQRIDSVSVQSNGDLLVTGYFENGGAGGGSAAYDTFVRKYKKTAPNAYMMNWSTTIGLAGIQDLISDSSLDPTDKTLYTVSRTDGQWTNTTGFLYAGGGDLLVQKLTAGDFNTDGAVDFADVQMAGTATKPGPMVGVDTYDFNGDGDSTFADTTYMITKIMDRAVGDIAQDPLVTDVDNADIGKAIGSSGSGTLYLQGDIDFDGDVDASDLTAMTGAFTGAKLPGKYTTGTTGTNLIYNSLTGTVLISAGNAAGGKITSFQLENSQGTFVTANYSGPTGGSFGGSLKEVTTNVIADTDLTFTGVNGTLSLGNVLPTGMDLAALQAYLTTAVYTGAPGSGQMRFGLVVVNSDYDIWALGFLPKDVSNPAGDFDGDGLSNNNERLFGLDPTSGSSVSPIKVALAPNAGTFSFTRRDPALTGLFSNIETSTDLLMWTRDNGAALVAGAADGNGVQTVAVTLSGGLLSAPKLFVRVVQDEGVILSKNFENDNGGFTLVGSPNDWAWGTPNSNNGFGFAVTTGNGGSARCWATVLGAGGSPSGGITPGANSILRSPDMNLTAATGAAIQFSAAVDAAIGNSVEVLVREVGTNALLDTVKPFTDSPLTETKTLSWASYGPFSIPNAAGKNVYLEFRYQGTDGTYIGLYIDDVTVRRTGAQ